MKKKFMKVLLAACMLLGLSACGAGNAEVSNVALESRVNEEMVYFASELDLKLEAGVEDVDFKVYGSTIYYPEGQTIVTYSTEDRSKTVDTYTWEDAPGQWVLERVSYGKGGDTYGVAAVGAGNTATRYLCKFNTERNLVFAKELAASSKEAGESYSAENIRLEVGDDGRVYLSTPGGILVFKTDGKGADNISFGNGKDVQVRDFQSDIKRNLYVLYEDNATQNQYVAEIDMEKDSVKNVQQSIGLTGIGSTEKEGQLLGYNGATVYTYYREECSLTELFHWTECKVTGEEVYSAKQLADERILVTGNFTAGSVENFLVKGTQSGAVLVGNGSTPGLNEAGKINLRLGVLVNPSEELRNSVYQFNKTNPRYNVLIEQYGEYALEGVELLHAEIERGNAPDLFVLDYGDVESLTTNGYLEDLSLYLMASDKISEGDFLNFALEEYNYDGMLVGIPQSFQMSVLIGNSEYVGEEPGWTLEEMVTFLEDYGNGDGSIYAEYYTTRGSVLGDMLRTNEALFVDRKAGICSFNTELFRRIVKVLADFPAEYDNSQVYAAYTNLQSGKSILAQEGITRFISLQPVAGALSGNLTCIGYPIEEGIGVRVSSSDAIGISALSEYKDGAWEFIEVFLQYVYVDGYGFPTYIPSVEKMAARALEHKQSGYMQAPDGFRYEYHATTPEEVEQVLELMEAAVVVDADTDLISIIREEINAYYAGEKNMGAMIADIESRVTEYLQESE